MKIGDAKNCNIVNFTGNTKQDVLACFDKLSEDDKESKLLDLKKKQREINEKAKKRF